MIRVTGFDGDGSRFAGGHGEVPEEEGDISGTLHATMTGGAMLVEDRPDIACEIDGGFSTDPGDQKERAPELEEAGEPERCV